MTDPIGDETAELVEKHLPDGSDPIVLVLKAHLLVEEQLIKLLETLAAHPHHIQNAKLAFPQKVEVVFAFLPLIIPREWLKATLLLNNMRNKLAHQINPKDLQHMERDFTQLIYESSIEISAQVILPGETHEEKFKTALVILIVGLAAARSALPSLPAAKNRGNSAA